MNKERLGFDAEREMKHLKEIVNKDDSITLSSRFVKYLIEQAERVQELEEEYKVRRVEYLEEHIDRMEQQNERYREALKQIYENYKTSKGAVSDEDLAYTSKEIARKALEGESE